MTESLDDIFIPPETAAGRNRRRRKRISLVTAVVVLAASMTWAGWMVSQSCESPWSGVYWVDGECVGVTDGSYLFDNEFKDVQEKIAVENARVRDNASSYVTVALLDLLTPTASSAKSAKNVRNELEGAYTAQRQINDSIPPTSSTPQIQLILANWGSTDNQWQRVIGQLVQMTEGDGPLVAVIGLGVSTEQTRLRAMKLSNLGISMVGTLLTADELDHNRIRGFIRVSPTTLDYAKALRRYVDTRNEIRSAVVVFDTNSDSGGDLFTKSLRDDIEQQMKNLIAGRRLPFEGRKDLTKPIPGNFDIKVTPNICATPTDIILYTGRRVDLDDFLDSLEKRLCQNVPLTLITAADIGELLGEREKQLTESKLTVVHAGTSDAEGWGRGVAGTPEYYGEFLSAFQGHGFNEKDLTDGQAIQMHDGLQTAVKAVHLASASKKDSPPTAAEVRSFLLSLSGVYRVPGAGGTLSFISRPAGEGNPVGKPVPVLKFPSPSDDPSGQQVVEPVYITE